MEYIINVLHMEGIMELPLFTPILGETQFDFRTIIPCEENDDPMERWGVPTNANCTCIHSGDVISFDTEEAPPFKVYEELSSIYPGTKIVVAWRKDGDEVDHFKAYRNGGTIPLDDSIPYYPDSELKPSFDWDIPLVTNYSHPDAKCVVDDGMPVVEDEED